MLSRQLSEEEMRFSTFKGAQTRMHRGSSIKSLLCWRSLIALSALKSSPMTIILAELRSQDMLREHRMLSRQLSEGEMRFSTFKGAQTRMHRGSSIKSPLCWRSLIALSALKSSPMTITLAEFRSQDILRERARHPMLLTQLIAGEMSRLAFSARKQAQH